MSLSEKRNEGAWAELAVLLDTIAVKAVFQDLEQAVAIASEHYPDTMLYELLEWWVSLATPKPRPRDPELISYTRLSEKIRRWREDYFSDEAAVLAWRLTGSDTPWDF